MSPSTSPGFHANPGRPGAKGKDNQINGRSYTMKPSTASLQPNQRWPSWNTPPICHADKGKTLRAIKAKLTQGGHQVFSATINTADHGAPPNTATDSGESPPGTICSSQRNGNGQLQFRRQNSPRSSSLDPTTTPSRKTDREPQQRRNTSTSPAAFRIAESGHASRGRCPTASAWMPKVPSGSHRR